MAKIVQTAGRNALGKFAPEFAHFNDDVLLGMRAHAKEMVFPIGAPNDGFAQYFSGKSFLAPVSSSQIGIFNVTFEPGCRKLAHSPRKERRRSDSGMRCRQRLLSGKRKRSHRDETGRLHQHSC